MKSFKLLLTGFAAVCLLSSCGGGGSGRSELLPLFDGETFVFFDDKGETAVKPEVNVTETSMFFEGYAVVGVKTDDGVRYGYLNTKGKLAIPAKYLSATIFRDGLAWVVEPNKAPTAINRKGEEVFVLPQAEDAFLFSEGLAAFSTKNEEGQLKYGYVNKSGNVVIQPVYDDLNLFTNGLAAAKTGDKYGFINRKGEMVIAAQFESAGTFNSSGYGIVEISSDKYCIIDKKGVCTTNAEYDNIMPDGNRFLVMKNGKCSVVDKSGKEIIPLQFSELLPSGSSDLMPASIDGKKYGYIDGKGKFAIDPQFEIACPFVGKAAIVVMSGKYGVIDKKGKIIANPVYDETSTTIVSVLFARRITIEAIMFTMNLSGYISIETDLSTDK
jgi:hypothetical protein